MSDPSDSACALPRAVFIGFASAVFLMAAFSSGVLCDSTIPRCDNQNTSCFSQRVQTPLHLNWHLKPQDRSGNPSQATLPPVLSGGRMFTGETNLFSVDLDDFQTLWSYERQGEWYTGMSPAILRAKTLYCTSGDGCAYAIDAETGKLKWKFTATRGAAWQTPILADGLLIFGSDGMYAVNCESGELVWRQAGIATITSSPACDSDRVYCGTRDGKLWALDKKTGALIWSHQSLRPVDTPPVVSGGKVFFGAESVCAVDAETGDRLWNADLGSPPSTWMATDGERVFLGCRNKEFYALDCRSGEVEWSFDPGGDISASPTVTKDIVWIGSENKTLYALDAKTGKELQKIQVGSKPTGWVVASDGVLYLPCEDGAIYRYSTQENELDIELKDVRVPERIETGETFEVEVTAKNTGSSDWPKRSYSIEGDLKDPEGNTRFEKPRLFSFDEDLAAGDEAKLTASIPAPQERGEYTLTLDLARDGKLVEFLPGHTPLTKTVRIAAAERENRSSEGEYVPLGYFEFDRAVRELESNKRALVLVEDRVYDDVKEAIDRYVEDVRAAFGFELAVERGTFASAAALREYLRDYHRRSPIQGVILVGLHPYAMWEMKSGEKGPAPLYYCDLDGEFTDSDGNGFLEKHTWGTYPYPEIWVSWIRSPVGSVEDYRRFFDKCHAYFTGDLGVPRRALAYVSHDWWMSCSDISKNLTSIFGPENVTSVGGREVRTQGEEYLRYLDEPYAVLDLWSHSGPLAHFLDTGPRSPVESKEILHTRGGGLIGFFWACHFGDIDEAGEEYGSTSAYLFGEGIGQAVIGVTRSIGTEYHEVMYRGLSQGLPLATSYLAYLREAYVDPQYQHSWNQDPPENFVFDLILFGNPFVAIGPARDGSGTNGGKTLIRGKAVDSFWDEPVAGARVTSAGGETVETTTDKQGFFEISTGPGDCAVTVEAEGLCPQTEEVHAAGTETELYFNLKSLKKTDIPKGVSLVGFPVNPILGCEGFADAVEGSLEAVDFKPKLAQKESAWLLGAGKGDLWFWDDGRFKRAIDKDSEGYLPGRGYILCVEEPTSLAVQGMRPSPRWPYEVPLGKGWNLVGNPFEGPVDWDSVSAKWIIWGMEPEKATLGEAADLGWVEPWAWELGPQGYLPARRLDPWKAQWVWAQTASQPAYGHPELIIPPPADPSAGASRSPTLLVPEGLDKKLDWYVRIGASVSPEDGAKSSIFPDLCNVFGVSKDAEDRLDRLDAHEPPPIDVSFKMEQLETACTTPQDEDPDDMETKVKKRREKYEEYNHPFISLSFADSDWSQDSGFYAFDIRKADGEPKSWLMVLRSDSEERRIELEWEMARAPVEQYSFKMVDTETEAEVDMSAENSYVFFTRPDEKARRFVITVSPKG
jgi:outer membrane protein assembly factor BamB